MRKLVAGVALAGTVLAGVAAAQTKTKGPAAGGMTHDITINADSVYTGTMQMAIAKGKVTGDLHVTAPTEIKGKVAGTAKAGVLSLDFPYQMTERQCEGTVKMEITLPARPGPATGTMEAIGCGRDETRKLTGTVELTPRAAKK